MTPERELLMDQATACRQLALIADAAVADRLKALASEYEALARMDKGVDSSPASIVTETFPCTSLQSSQPARS